MAAEIRAAARIFADMDALDTTLLCAGMPVGQQGGVTGCTP